MNKKQYDALDRSDHDVQARLKNVPVSNIITTKTEFNNLRKSHPTIPEWIWPQVRAKGIDEDHVKKIKKDMNERYERGDRRPQETPITVFDIGGLYGIPKSIPTLIASDGGHRMRAIRGLDWQIVSVYEVEPPKNKYEVKALQFWDNAHGVIAKSNDIETFQTNFADLMKDEREGKDIGNEFDSEIYKLMSTFEDTIRNGTDRERKAMKKAMKAALISEWPMFKDDASKLLKECIQYENSDVSYNGQIDSNLGLLELVRLSKKATNRVGLRYDESGKVSEVVVSTQNADNVKDAFAKLEDVHMEILLGEYEQELSPDVEFSVVFGYKYRQQDIGKPAAGVVTLQRAKAVSILNKKLAYRGDSLKFKFGKLYFPDQIRGKESKTLEISTNAKGLFPAIKKGIYDSKNLENPKITYKGW